MHSKSTHLKNISFDILNVIGTTFFLFFIWSLSLKKLPPRVKLFNFPHHFNRKSLKQLRLRSTNLSQTFQLQIIKSTRVKVNLFSSIFQLKIIKSIESQGQLFMGQLSTSLIFNYGPTVDDPTVDEFPIFAIKHLSMFKTHFSPSLQKYLR